ncbi:hypothetical protein BBK36DRAFT_1134509, partial [Trichoderma citrinoviride]
MSSSRQPQPRRSSGRTQLACEPCRKRKSKCDGEKPVCGSCQSHELACHYEPVRPTRRQKYWDRDYVQALEDQVRLLSASLQQQQQQQQQSKDPPSASASASPTSQPSPGASSSEAASKQQQPPPVQLPYGPRMLSALHDFGSVKWADITGRDGLPILAGPGRFSFFSTTLLPTFEDDGSSPSSSSSRRRRRPSPASKAINVPSTETFLLDIASDLRLKQHLKAHFLAHINPYYKFVDPVWLNFSDLFPHNDTALQLLYSALFAAAAYSSPVAAREVAEAFMAYAESLVQHCYLEHLCLPVLQALIIIAWYKHMQLDAAKGHLYHYMAIGLSNHLEIRDTPQHERTVDDVATIRTFWSLFFLDRVATPKLGVPTGIPWEPENITPYIDTVSPEMVDVEALSFDHHCRLYQIQQRYIDVRPQLPPPPRPGEASRLRQGKQRHAVLPQANRPPPLHQPQREAAPRPGRLLDHLPLHPHQPLPSGAQPRGPEHGAQHPQRAALGHGVGDGDYEAPQGPAGVVVDVVGQLLGLLSGAGGAERGVEGVVRGGDAVCAHGDEGMGVSGGGHG